MDRKRQKLEGQDDEHSFHYPDGSDDENEYFDDDDGGGDNDNNGNEQGVASEEEMDRDEGADNEEVDEDLLSEESDDEEGDGESTNPGVELKERGVVFDKGILNDPIVLRKTNKTAKTLFDEVKISDQQMVLKKNPENYPLYVTSTGRFYLESFAPHYTEAYDFVVTIADPVTRQKFIQEFKLTKYSLFSAIVIGKDYKYVKDNLERFLKTTEIPTIVENFIQDIMEKYGKARLVLRGNKHMVESYFQNVIRELAANKVFKESWMIFKGLLKREVIVKKPRPVAPNAPSSASAHANVVPVKLDQKQQEELNKRNKFIEKTNIEIQSYLDEDDDDSILESSLSVGAGSSSVNAATATIIPGVTNKCIYGFEIDNADIEEIKRCGYEMGYPLIEEYSYKDEPKTISRPFATREPSGLVPLPPPQQESIMCDPLKINLRSFVAIRPYQEKSLSRMFASSRARSGIIVLACGAGKTLVGITAACTIQKSCLVVCNSTVSVYQWKNEFLKWSDIKEDSIALFTREEKKNFNTSKLRPLVIANYNILTMADNNVNQASRSIRAALQRKEWGLIILDEVQVAMADMFKDVVKKIKAHCKLGLTATLIREDNKIEETNFLIGPKLYEANWMDLARNGFLATVQCIEVRCKMEENFLREYLKINKDISRKRLLAVLNPNKMRCCHFLVQYHAERGDKIIIFADLVRVLDKCKEILGDKCKCIKGQTVQRERIEILDMFREGKVNTLIISRVGDTSIDLPDANVIIQISSQFGSRRQEAQRLGRILRKKQGKYATDEVNAFFYTLVSQDTNEMFYTTKRQQFLIDQGYSYKVVPDLEKYNKKYELCFEKEEDCNKLLEYAKGSSAKQDSEGGAKKGTGKRGRSARKKNTSINDLKFNVKRR